MNSEKKSESRSSRINKYCTGKTGARRMRQKKIIYSVDDQTKGQLLSYKSYEAPVNIRISLGKKRELLREDQRDKEQLRRHTAILSLPRSDPEFGHLAAWQIFAILQRDRGRKKCQTERQGRGKTVGDRGGVRDEQTIAQLKPRLESRHISGYESTLCEVYVFMAMELTNETQSSANFDSTEEDELPPAKKMLKLTVVIANTVSSHNAVDDSRGGERGYEVRAITPILCERHTAMPIGFKHLPDSYLVLGQEGLTEWGVEYSQFQPLITAVLKL
ncbi:hypothetical protein PPACK8108_LOCUS9936 [Phakopsora pachyrhizi]|uniref:Uncharacterized protein n=1 Tax=Phakopsora pachyrhizi TaxID=170000 RepID=A0AAV0AXG1_PHAPC|nr:hypothetical protein PPACK8108_LOCUS9936 [Phakopsora pachyrhizi]